LPPIYIVKCLVDSNKCGTFAPIIWFITIIYHTLVFQCVIKIEFDEHSNSCGVKRPKVAELNVQKLRNISFVMVKKYRNRIADILLLRKMQGKGAVLVQGPKWCGKTTTAKQVAASILDLGDTAVLENAIETFHVIPTNAKKTVFMWFLSVV